MPQPCENKLNRHQHTLHIKLNNEITRKFQLGECAFVLEMLKVMHRMKNQIQQCRNVPPQHKQYEGKFPDKRKQTKNECLALINTTDRFTSNCSRKHVNQTAGEARKITSLTRATTARAAQPTNCAEIVNLSVNLQRRVNLARLKIASEIAVAVLYFRLNAVNVYALCNDAWPGNRTRTL